MKIIKNIIYPLFFISALLISGILFENLFLRDLIVDCQKGVVVEINVKSSIHSPALTHKWHSATLKLTESGRLIENVKYSKALKLAKLDSVYVYFLDNGSFQIGKN